MMPAVSDGEFRHQHQMANLGNPLYAQPSPLLTKTPIENGSNSPDLISLGAGNAPANPLFAADQQQFRPGLQQPQMVPQFAPYIQQQSFSQPQHQPVPSSTPQLNTSTNPISAYNSPLLPPTGASPLTHAPPPGGRYPPQPTQRPGVGDAPGYGGGASTYSAMKRQSPAPPIIPATVEYQPSVQQQQPPLMHPAGAQPMFNQQHVNGQHHAPPHSQYDGRVQGPPLSGPSMLSARNPPADGPPPMIPVATAPPSFPPTSSQFSPQGAPVQHHAPPPPMGPPPVGQAHQSPALTPRGYPHPHQLDASGGSYPGSNLATSGPAPPQPGSTQTQQPGSYSSGYQTAGPGYAQQQKKLDPDHMPSPIQVMFDDNETRKGNFPTLERGSVPPLCTTSFVCQDQGNVNPRMMHSILYSLPCNSDMYNQSHVPMGVAITPFARLHKNELQPPIVDMGELGPIRCTRCKAYMCPNMSFIDGGRRYQCCFCICINEVPEQYFNHLDHTGRRMDTYERPELSLGAYEFIATKDYCKNDELPQAPAYIFMLDVSYNSVKSGLLDLICDYLKQEVLLNLAVESGYDETQIKVGFVTYDKELHFYNVKGTLAQPQMLVVADVDDVFLPLLDGFLVGVSESEMVIDSLLEQIKSMFAGARETETVLGPVIQAGLSALKSARRPGKLIIMHTSLPIAQAPGHLKNRDDRKLIGTDKEKNMLVPQTNFYEKLGEECVQAGCAVDLYLFPNSYIDVSTVGSICRVTGGNLYKYSYFQADLDGERLLTDLRQNVSQPVAFDAIVRVRTSTGIRATDFYGNFFMENTTDMEFGAIDPYKSVCVEIKHDDKLNENEGGFVQAAVLYTSIVGQRRIRILNLALNCTSNLADMYRSCELDTLVAFMARKAMRGCMSNSTKAVREQVTSECAQILACYRRNCATNSSAGQLILPECMKLLPLYLNCIIRNTVVSTSEASFDDRCYLMAVVNSLDLKSLGAYFYPRLYPLHDLTDDRLPFPIRCSKERLEDDGVYLLENGMVMYLWFGLNVDSGWLNEVFGFSSPAQVDVDAPALPELNTPTSQLVRSVVSQARAQRSRQMKLRIVRQRDKLEVIFHQMLVEDRGNDGSPSYVDYLCHVHKEIRNILS